LPRGKASLLVEQIEALLRTDGSRHVDLGATLRVHRCTCGVSHVDWPKGKDHSKHFAAPAELVTDATGKPRVWGGRYDRLLRRYVGDLESTTELKCHAGQIQLLTLSGDDAYGRPLDSPEVLRILALGSPGAGKTMGAVTRALLMALDRPNSTGGLIGPTGDRRQILWDAFLEVCPRAWIQDIRTSKKEIVLVNNTVVQVLAAKASSSQYGSPLQGRSFDWAVPDESQNIDDAGHTEIATRGRRAGGSYRIFETATNAAVPAFRVRLEQFKANPLYRRINFTGYSNPWVEPEYWHKMRGEMSTRDFREKILAEDVPPERLVYPRFSMAENIAPAGMLPPKPADPARAATFWLNDIERKRLGRLRDVTEKLTFERFNVASKYIIAQDFGVLINAAEVLKVYQAETGDLFWWAIDEITSGGGTDLHAYKLKNYYDPSECVVIADPHFNSKESDKSDYNIMREQGWETFPSTHGKISVKHRIAMFNALLEDADGRRRFFVDCDGNGVPKCTRLVRSLVSSELNDYGEAEKDRKNGASDPSHWPSAVQFGLFHWERKRGGRDIKSLGEPAKKKWYEET
jgi:hypothetical protein